MRVAGVTNLKRSVFHIAPQGLAVISQIDEGSLGFMLAHESQWSLRLNRVAWCPREIEGWDDCSQS